jgi:hypothetical protein
MCPSRCVGGTILSAHVPHKLIPVTDYFDATPVQTQPPQVWCFCWYGLSWYDVWLYTCLSIHPAWCTDLSHYHVLRWQKDGSAMDEIHVKKNRKVASSSQHIDNIKLHVDELRKHVCFCAWLLSLLLKVHTLWHGKWREPCTATCDMWEVAFCTLVA